MATGVAGYRTRCSCFGDSGSLLRSALESDCDYSRIPFAGLANSISGVDPAARFFVLWSDDADRVGTEASGS